jgi:hypothetical protein
MRGTGAAALLLGLVAWSSAALGVEGKPAGPAAPAAPPSAAAQKGRELLEQDRVEEAEKHLRAALAAAPTDVEVRLVLGNVLDWDGKAEEAAKTWEEGLTGKEADVPLLVALARLHARRAADGPAVTRRRGNSEMQVDKMGGDEGPFKKAEAEASLAARRKAAALRPADRDLAMDLADALAGSGRNDEALKAWEAVSKKDGKNVRALIGWAGALMASGKPAEAKPKIDQAVKLAPRSSEAHLACSRWLEAAGKKAEAEAELHRAQLFGWLPDFSKLEYSDALYDRAKTMAADPFWSAKDEKEAEAMHAAKRAVVDALVAAKDEPSYDLLACICWNHCAHGPVEDAAFHALEARGKPSAPILLRMLKEGGATCTVGAAARALARLKEPAALDEMLRRLPRDVDPMFPMGIAAALATFGDPRAVPALVAALDLDAPPAPPAPKKKGGGRTVVIGAPGVDPDAVLDGRGSARGRAALALGEFAAPEARAALEKGAGNPEIGGYCHAVLWRLTKDEKAHGKFVAAAMNGDGVAPSLIGPYLERIDHPNAKMLFENWKRERAKK